MSRGELARLIEGRARTLAAWEKMVLAHAIFQRFNTADNAACRRLLEEALQSDPECTSAMAMLGISHYWDARYSVTVDQPRSLELAERMAEKVSAIDPDLTLAHVLKGAIALTRDRHDEALVHGKRASDLAPGDSWALGWLGVFNVHAGNLREADAALRLALRLSPIHDAWLIYYSMLAYLWAGDFSAAFSLLDVYQQQEPDEPYGFAYRAILHGLQNQWDEAKQAIVQLHQKAPSFSLANIRSSERYRDRSSPRPHGSDSRAGRNEVK